MPPMVAQSPTEMRMSQCSRKSWRTATFSSLQQPPFDQPDRAPGREGLEVVDGGFVEIDQLHQLQDAVVDVQQGHVAAEATRQRRGRDLGFGHRDKLLR
jgi:hypothetical protein